MPHLLYRSGRYYYSRRVPKKLRDFDPREMIRISLETDSPSEAERKSAIIHERIEAYWKNLVATGEKHTGKTFRMAVEFARLLGFSYRENHELAAPATPLGELVQRYREVSRTENNAHYVAALLGGPSPPGIGISEMLDRFWDITKDRIMHKTPDQQRKWKNPRIRAIRNFIKVVGDKPVTEVTREDIIVFRDWWIGRLERETKDISTVNKDLIHLKNVMETVSENDRIPVDTAYLFRKITLKKRFAKTRAPFTAQEIINILESPKLEKLNEDARWFLFAAAETGARPAEIVGLMPEDIVLKAKIPHIRITDRPDRPLKTPHSQREIPLVGYALEAFRANPKGFPRYRDKPDNLTNLLNKFLRSNDLFPSDRHSVYSLRHSFQDRILSVNAPDRVQAELMGHKFQRPVYGDGASLQQKLEWVVKIQLMRLNSNPSPTYKTNKSE